MAEPMPGARLHVIEGGSHFPKLLAARVIDRECRPTLQVGTKPFGVPHKLVNPMVSSVGHMSCLTAVDVICL